MLVTRPEGQGVRLAELLRDAGFDPVLVAVAELTPSRDGAAVREVWESLDAADWLVVTSPTGAGMLGAGAPESGWAGLRRHPRVAAVGTATVRALNALNIPVEVVPDQHDGEALWHALAARVVEQSVVVAQAANARPVLRDGLAKAGARVAWFGIYESHDRIAARVELQHALREGLDWVTATSSEIVRATVRAAGEAELALLHRCRVASIGVLTTATLQECGFAVTIEADPSTSEALVRAMRAWSDGHP